ncbi:MAG TPA: ABC transporter substrate-binding protein, partial [Burkholderiaceae bacterium]|nr:ABC transporter substrate-binding protein [Burkholderiaceae bacterium]
MSIRKNPAARAATLAAIAVAMAFGATSAMAQKRGGTLIVGSEAEFNGFEHLKVRGMNSNTLAPATAVMEGLFTYVGDKIEPRLGLELKDSPDRSSATVTLRRGVTFHDGTPFNADAVVYHYKRILDPASSIGGAALISPISAVEAVDEHTVRFKLKHPWASLKSALALDSMINLIGSPTALQKDRDAFHRKPIGTGPFVFEEWRAGDRVIMSRNKSYWDKKLPYVDNVTFRIVPDDITLHQSVKSGEIHMALANSARPVLDARKDPSLQVVPYVGASTLGWGFNHSKPPFNDVRVRRAMVHAFNNQAFA